MNASRLSSNSRVKAGLKLHLTTDFTEDQLQLFELVRAYLRTDTKKIKQEIRKIYDHSLETHGIAVQNAYTYYRETLI
jgi:hypothetical protein